MEKLRIAHVDTERSWRGGEQQVYSLIQGLKDLGHDNLLICRRGSDLSRRAATLVRQMRVCPIGEWDMITAHFVNRRLKKEQIDVVHAHTGHGVSLAVLSTLGTKIPVVITRRVDFHLSRNIFSQWKYQRPAKIVAISEGVKNILLSDGIPADKISVVPSGVDFRRYAEIRPQTKAGLGVSANALLIGQVAALAPHKDQLTLLHAVSLVRPHFPHLKVLVFGEGELRRSLQEKINHLELQSVVELRGFVERPLDVIPAFDLFCLSSKEEGLGTSLLDAMALRVPVVATRVGGIPELIEEGRTGFLAEPQNPGSLAEAIKRAWASPRRAEIITAAAQKALNFDISNTIRSMEAIYRELSTKLST